MAPRRASDSRSEAERSFELLYRGHRRDVYEVALRALGNRQDAEDVTQAAFVDAYRAVLRGTRPHAPRAWLLTIAENVRRRRFRTSLRRPREGPLDEDAALAADDSHEQAGALLDALATLTPEQREAFVLREITGLSYEEIAERMESTVASVQMLLFRARKSLRDELEPPNAYGALVPLATLASRFESFSLTPRVAAAVGATALALGVSASVPVQADPPLAKPSVPHLAAAAPVAPPAWLVPAKREPATTRTRAASVRAAAPVIAVSQPVRPPAPATAAPALEREPAQPQPEPARATPPTLPLAVPVVSTPSIPLPPLGDPLVETLLEGAGAAGAAGAGAPPLPVLPLVPPPPIP